MKRGQNRRIKINVTNISSIEYVLDSGEDLGTVDEIQSITPLEVKFQKFDEPQNAQVAELTKLETGEDPMQSFRTIEEDDIDDNNKALYKSIKEMEFPELTAEQKNAMRDMLWHEKKAFSCFPDDIGSAQELKLDIHTTDEVPVQRNYNSIPKPLLNDVKQHIQGMLDRKWIQKSQSAWSSPVVLARKKNGSFRLCCDFRLLNKKTIPDKHPIPRIQEALDSLQGSKFFSVLDLSRAYHQGYMSESARKKTAFVTPWGFYEWVRIPFGLSNAVPTFQRFMEETLEDYRDDFALPYLDDTIVFSKTAEEHIHHIRDILKKFQQKGLKLNITKCHMFKKEVGYLGRVVSREGYRMDENNVKAVTELSRRKFQTIG